jgi:hypothetical protein
VHGRNDSYLVVALQALQRLGGRVLDLHFIRARHTLKLYRFCDRILAYSYRDEPPKLDRISAEQLG